MSAVMELALDPEKSYEIVNGQPEEKETAGGTHGAISANIVILPGFRCSLNDVFNTAQAATQNG